MSKVSIHPPKTPVTKGSGTVARATLPNVCKMPGPPAPFIPSPLPNIARSGDSPKGYTKTVKIEGNNVAVRGASFNSKGDAASKGMGGGLVSANTHGPAKFITPGSLTVKADGKAIHLLGEPMLNNCGPSGAPPNTGATMMGAKHKKGKKDSGCPHDELETQERSHDEAIAHKQKNLDQAKKDEAQALADMETAAAELANPPPGSRKSQLRQKVKQTAKAYEGAKAYTGKQQQAVDSAKREKKVAEDCGGGTNYRILCKACKNEIGDYDVVTTDGRVKEVKSSRGGFSKKQFDKLKKLTEDDQLLGPGKTMKIAMPPGSTAALVADHPDLKGRVQEH